MPAVSPASSGATTPSIPRVGRWTDGRHRARLAEQFARHPDLFDMLRRDGYETDGHWLGTDAA